MSHFVPVSKVVALRRVKVQVVEALEELDRIGDQIRNSNDVMEKMALRVFYKEKQIHTERLKAQMRSYQEIVTPSGYSEEV